MAITQTKALTRFFRMNQVLPDRLPPLHVYIQQNRASTDQCHTAYLISLGEPEQIPQQWFRIATMQLTQPHV